MSKNKTIKYLLRELRHDLTWLTGLTAYDTGAPILAENAIPLDFKDRLKEIDELLASPYVSEKQSY